MTEEEKQAQEEAQAKIDAQAKLVNDENDTEDGTDEADTSADSSNTDEEGQKIPYSRFKDKVDEANRLAKQLKEIETSQEAKKLEELKEQEKYKELYEGALEEIESIKSQGAKTKIENELREAGYKEEQITRLSKLVEGETDEEVTKSIEDLKIAFPTKSYVDPSPDQRKRQKHEGVGGDDIGQTMFDRLRKSGKLKGFK